MAIGANRTLLVHVYAKRVDKTSFVNFYGLKCSMTAGKMGSTERVCGRVVHYYGKLKAPRPPPRLSIQKYGMQAALNVEIHYHGFFVPSAARPCSTRLIFPGVLGCMPYWNVAYISRFSLAHYPHGALFKFNSSPDSAHIHALGSSSLRTQYQPTSLNWPVTIPGLCFRRKTRRKESPALPQSATWQYLT